MRLLLVMCKQFRKSNSLNLYLHGIFTFSLISLILSTLKADHDFVFKVGTKIAKLFRRSAE